MIIVIITLDIVYCAVIMTQLYQEFTLLIQ